MSTEITTTVNQDVIIKHLDTLGLTSSLSTEEKETYIQIATAFNLNPFKREIYVSKYGSQMSVITGYEVYIKRAERTGQLDGWSATTEGSVKDGNLKAVVTIYRKDRSHPFIWEALYEECVQRTREGKVTKFWEKAAFMTKKVAISQGFRLCFSDELAGMPYTADEMPDKESFEDVTHEEIKTTEVVIQEFDYTATLESANTSAEVKQIYTSIPKELRLKYKELATTLGEELKKSEELENNG